MDIKQRVGESSLDWKHRVLIAKINKEISESWTEIRDTLGIQHSVDHLRKVASGVYEYHNNLQPKSLIKSEIASVHEEDLPQDESVDVLEELAEKTLQMEKTKYQLADQRRELNNIKRREARHEEIYTRILKEIKNLAIEKPIKWNPMVTDYAFETDEREAALLLSDWHKGLFTENYWNTLDDAEFERRLKRLVSLATKYSMEQNVSVFNVFGLGDFVNGLIHVTTRISNSENVIKQTMAICEIFAEMLAHFASKFKVVNYYHVRGNHDRVTPNKNDEIAEESFADFIPFYLKARLASIKNINFIDNKYDSEIIVTEILGKKIFAVHGHRDRISSVVENLSLMTREIPDYIFMGHYHHHEENEVQGVEVIINSSFSGVDSYAKEIRKTSNPAQKLLIFDKYEGRLCTYNIRLNI